MFRGLTLLRFSPLAGKGSLSDSQTLFNNGRLSSGLLTRAASRATNAADDDPNTVISETEFESSQEPSQDPSQDPDPNPMGRQPLATLFPPPQLHRPAQGSSDIIMATIHGHLLTLGESRRKDVNECEKLQKDIQRYMEARTKEKQKARDVHSELKRLQIQLENVRTALTKLAADIEFN
jgi:hypothetical protein